MKNYSGSVGKIESFSTVDGPGIRSTVFLTGCALRCIYCHNPEFLEKKENNITAEELANKLLKNKLYFKNGGGVTFSGGEPLLQSEFIIEVSKILKKNNIHIALDTAGVGRYNSNIFDYIDLVILDIKGSTEELYQKITGTNRLIETLSFLEICQNKNLSVIIRQVIVPDINDTKEEMLKLMNILKPYQNIIKIELLGYHNMAVDKYQTLNKEYPLKELKSLSPQKLEELQRYVDDLFL